MVPNWKNWCRLCAREDPANTHLNVLENKSEQTYSDVINKYFSIDVHHGDDWPQTICTQCHQFITSLINFVHRTSKVQAMFAEIFNNLEDLDVEQLRAQYDLDELGDVELDLKLFSSSPSQEHFDPKPDIGGADGISEQMIDLEELEYIDEEMLNPTHIKTERLDEDDGNTYKEEWRDELEPEQGDDSDKSIDFTTKYEEEDLDNDDKEKSKIKKRGRPRIKLETFSCSACKKQFAPHTKYADHMQEEHGITVDPLPYNCTKCNKGFSTPKAFQKHELTHLPLDQKLKIPCPYCDKKFTKMDVVQGHIRAVHFGEKPFICEECGKACKTFGALKEHKLTHTEETPFKCRYCEKSFKNKSRLKTHEDTHNETNYICTSCGLQLNTRRTLKMHMLVHSDQKRHKCNFCGNEYKRAKALKNHLILHTGLKPYTCNFCDKTFANGSNCRSHKKKAHPIELAAMEAAGTKIINPNIPKLEQLRAVTSNKSVVAQQPPVGSLGELGQQFGSNVSLVSIPDDVESLRGHEQLTAMLKTTKEEEINQEQSSNFVNNIGFGQLQES